MELLTILYAMLAALTGFSVGDAAPARQPLVVAAQTERVEAAVASVHAVSVASVQRADQPADFAARQASHARAGSPANSAGRPVAWIDYQRRHL